MNEKGSKRRDWVKNAAIIFLTIMLILTFFSNTIMNYSLPEVAVQYVQSGSITTRIRGTGYVESDDPYKVEIPESRKIISVAVREGDAVQRGDILFLLEDAESDELKAAHTELEQAQDNLKTKQDDLKTAQEAYYNAMLAENITAEDIQAANSDISASTYRQQITDMQNALKPLEERKAELEKQISDIETQVALEGSLDTAAEQRVPVAKKALETAQSKLTSAEDALKKAEDALKNAQTNYNEKEADLRSAEKYVSDVTAGDALASEKLQTAQKEFEEAKKTLGEAQKSFEDAQNAYNSAKQDRDNAQSVYNNALSDQDAREGSQATVNLSTQKAYLELELYNLENQITDTKKPLEDLIGLLANKMTLDTFQKSIESAQREVDKARENVSDIREKVESLTQKSIGAAITADIAGTVTKINVVAGNTVTMGTTLAELQPEGAGYTMSFSVTMEQARRLTPGTKAELSNSWWYNDVEVTLSSIRPDPNNPSQSRLLVFNVTGSVTDGQSLSVSIGDRSANYEMVVPNSAIREDSNGKFVLTIESKSSPLGTRYVATRVDVEVVASDDTQSAITGGLYTYSYVITTSDIPVSAGQQVRLADN